MKGRIKVLLHVPEAAVPSVGLRRSSPRGGREKGPGPRWIRRKRGKRGTKNPKHLKELNNNTERESLILDTKKSLRSTQRKKDQKAGTRSI